MVYLETRLFPEDWRFEFLVEVGTYTLHVYPDVH